MNEKIDEMVKDLEQEPLLQGNEVTYSRSLGFVTLKDGRKAEIQLILETNKGRWMNEIDKNWIKKEKEL